MELPAGKKYDNIKKYKLSEEEQEMLTAFEEGKTASSADRDDLIIEAAKAAAKNYTKKTERINIRLTQYDLSHIKRIAAQEGLPYQTLISSVLHKGFIIE